VNRPVNGFKQLNDSLSFYWDIMSNDNEFVLFNNHKKANYAVVAYPEWVENPTMDQPKIFTYMKNDIVKSDGTMFASFYSYFKRIRIHDNLGNLQKEIFVNTLPFNTTIEDKTKDRLVSYYGYPRTINDFIYVFCKNRKYSEMEDASTTELQVWKWDATPIASYEIDANLSVFDISEKYKKIYAVDNYNENNIYVFDLPYY
jgi:hypothetical protein